MATVNMSMESSEDSALDQSADLNSDVGGSTTNELEEELPKMALKASADSPKPSLVLPPAAGVPTTCYDSTGTFSTTSSEWKTAWYNDPKYASYWAHWRRMKDWFKKHTEIYDSYCKKQWEISYRNWYKAYHSHCMHYHTHLYQGQYSPHSTIPGHKTQSGTHQQARPKRMDRSLSSSRLNKRKQKRRRTKSARSGQAQVKSAKSTDIEMEMEITEEMTEFMVKSALHRKEREAQKLLDITNEDGKVVDYINVSEVSSSKHRATTDAPTAQPGSQRTAEMKYLYGKGAAMIHGMETAMQLQFDRKCDKMDTKPWPVIPLNLKFN